MMKRLLLLAGTALVFSAPAYALSLPTVQVNGVSVPVTLNDKGGGTVEGYTFNSGSDPITVNATTDPDPGAVLSVSFTDNDAPSPFAGVVEAPINPLTGTITLNANAIVTGLDNVDNANGGTITPAIVLDQTTYTAFDVNGTILLQLVTDPITYPTGGSTSRNADGSINVDCSLLTGGTCNSLSIAFGVNGAGSGDPGSVLASVSVRGIPVPPPVAEPMTLALMGVGLTGLAFARRRW